MLLPGQRGIIEIDFHNTGRFMFQRNQSDVTEAGWMASSKVRRLMAADLSRREAFQGDAWRMWRCPC